MFVHGPKNRGFWRMDGVSSVCRIRATIMLSIGLTVHDPTENGDRLGQLGV